MNTIWCGSPGSRIVPTCMRLRYLASRQASRNLITLDSSSPWVQPLEVASCRVGASTPCITGVLLPCDTRKDRDRSEHNGSEQSRGSCQAYYENKEDLFSGTCTRKQATVDSLAALPCLAISNRDTKSRNPSCLPGTGRSRKTVLLMP